MIAISLGWGVQSFTLAAMSALGVLPRVDVAIHADTRHERSDTYSFAAKYTSWLEDRGIRVVTVYNPITAPIDDWGGVFIPAFTSNGKTDGQLRRQCTGRWKIAPMREWLQANRNGSQVEQWLGISTDEYQRMRDSDVKYISNRYPLIDMRYSRYDCTRWLYHHDLDIPPKSACVFCPFHNQGAWIDLKHSGNDDWSKAVEVDEAIRSARPPFDLFVHPSRKPLRDVDLRTAHEQGQLSLWDNECQGVCGI